MSAFVVKDRTIDRIVTFLGDHRNADMARIFEALGYNLADKPEAFALALFDMNCEAVYQRYDDKQPARTAFHPASYRHQTDFHYTDGGILKAAGCLRYQCSEGDVPETPLFKALEEFGDVGQGEHVCLVLGKRWGFILVEDSNGFVGVITHPREDAAWRFFNMEQERQAPDLCEGCGEVDSKCECFSEEE